MQEKLRQKLILIISIIFVLPTLIVFYIFYEHDVTLSPTNIVLMLFMIVLAIIGTMLIRYVFDAVATTTDFLKKASEGGEKLSLNLHKEAAEMHEISSHINIMLERLEKTTESLNQASRALDASEKKYRNTIKDIQGLLTS